MAGEEDVMDCKHERQARLDQWIEDQTGSACAFCLKDEVEQLKAKNDLLIKAVDDAQFERAKAKQDREGIEAEVESLREALEGAIQLAKELLPYKSDYLVDKHDDKGELKRLEETLKEIPK